MIRFEAEVYDINGWMILHLPQDASSQLPSRGQVMVKGTINDSPLLAALEPDGNHGHWLHVDSSMQKSSGLEVGDMAVLAIEATKEWPEPVVPADVQKGIVDNSKTHDLWLRVTPMARWEWLRWINSTSQAETRAKRIVVSADKLMNGERRPCCFNRNMCCVPEVSKSGVLLEPATASK